jgi:hypothetical protein
VCFLDLTLTQKSWDALSSLMSREDSLILCEVIKAADMGLSQEPKDEVLDSDVIEINYCFL